MHPVLKILLFKTSILGTVIHVLKTVQNALEMGALSAKMGFFWMILAVILHVKRLALFLSTKSADSAI